MQCPRCQQENPPGARFCNSCGAGLELTCPAVAPDKIVPIFWMIAAALDVLRGGHAKLAQPRARGDRPDHDRAIRCSSPGLQPTVTVAPSRTASGCAPAIRMRTR